jgi:hypothetical protein
MHSKGTTQVIPCRTTAGLTTLELVVSLSLLAAALAGLGGLGQTAIRATLVHEARLDVQQAARRGLERVADEIRWAEAVVPDPLCGGLCPNRLTVRVPAGNPYRRDASYNVTFQHNVAQREIERRLGTGVNNLASLIHRLEFSYFDANGVPTSDPSAVTRVGVTLAAETRGGPHVMLDSAVSLRNFRPPPRPTPTRTPVWRPAPRWLRPSSPPSGGGPPPGIAPAAR